MQQRPLRHRAALATVAVASIVAGASCAGDDAGPSSTTTATPPSPTSPASTGGDDRGIDHPDSRSELAIEVDATMAWHSDGGSAVLIGGDGSVYRREADRGPAGWTRSAGVGRSVAMVPVPPSPEPFTVSQLTVTGMDRVYERADELGLLSAPVPDYEGPTATDQGTASVNVAAGGAVLEHRLYDPQSPDDEYTDERARLATFIDELSNLESLVGDENISDPEPYVPERWIVSTVHIPGATDEPPDWPFDGPPREGCVTLPSDTDRDTASGLYTAPTGGEGGSDVWQVEPAFPWTGDDDCS